MQTKRDKLLVRPWQMQRYENHKRNARPAIDFSSPPVYSHVTLKLKKQQAEKERQEQIKKDNVRLLQRLGSLMLTKRIENFWQQPRPDFLSRERIYASRPKTSSGRIESIITSEESIVPHTQIKVRGRSAGRCATCSGKPAKRNQVVPEERIPWEPPRKSWNRKIHNDTFKEHVCCPVCCQA